MKVVRPFSIDEEVYKSFTEVVQSGNRSQIVEELLKDYLDKYFPKKNKIESMDMKKRELELKLQEIEEQEALERKREAELVAKREEKISVEVESQRVAKLRDDLLRKARILSAAELGLSDSLVDSVLDSSVSDSDRLSYRLKVREHHSRLCLEAGLK